MPIEYVTSGESHGAMLAGIIKNIPAGLTIDEKFINGELARRRAGYGRSSRMTVERDRVRIVSGVYNGATIASPITLLIENTVGDSVKDKLTAVRPGHADLTGVVKYGFDDARCVAERASARSTAMTVALGAIAKLYLRSFGIEICSHTTAIGGITADACNVNLSDINKIADKNPVRCLDVRASEKMIEQIDIATQNGDTLGGVSEIIVIGCKSGFGSYVSSDKRLDGLIMREVGVIPSVKAVEIGDGINASRAFGSEAHDRVYSVNGVLSRSTNRAGGIEGGMSNGEPIVVRAYFKPVPTLAKGNDTVDIVTKTATLSASVRSDVCIVPAGGVVCEASVALALSAAISDSLGGDTMNEAISRYGAKRSVYD